MADMQANGIKNALTKQGLDVDRWLPKFKEHGLEHEGALQHVQGDTTIYSKLESYVKHEWEKKALQKIFKVSIIGSEKSGKQEDIELVLKEQGLSTEYWLPKFRAKGIVSKAALQHAQMDDDLYSSLDEFVKYDWERKALQSILKVESKNQKKLERESKEKAKAQKKQKEEEGELEKKKQELVEKKEKAMSILKELEKARVEGKQRHDERVQKLEEEARSKLNISPESWVSRDKSLDELVDKLKAHHDMLGGALQTRQKWSDAEVLEKASGGRALQGVLLTKNFEDQLTERSSFLLKAPENVSLGRASQSVDRIKQFSRKHQEDVYKKTVDVLGHGVAVSSTIPVYGSVAISAGMSESTKTEEEHMKENHSEELYCSTVKHSSVQLATYSFKNCDLKLSDDAIGELEKLARLIRAGSSSVQTACETFFKKYGSHVNKGPVYFGGTYWWTCSSAGFRIQDKTEVKNLQSQAVSISGGVSVMGFGASTEVNIEKIKGEYSGKCSDTTLAHTHLTVNVNGGPVEVSDLSAWKVGLVSYNSTWKLADRGNRFIAVWDIIAMNYSDELGETIGVLRTAWEDMTGLIAEKDLQSASYIPERVLKQVTEWNDTSNLAPKTIEEYLEYLIEVKRDLIHSTGNPHAWLEEYLHQSSLQEFLVSVMDTYSDGRAKFLMQQVLEPLDLRRLTSRTFPDKERLSAWLYSSDVVNKPPGVVECSDFQTFNMCLIKIIEEMQIALHLGKSEKHRHEYSVKTATEVAKAVHSLRSHFKESIEDILITTFVFPFKDGDSEDPITLNPLTLEDMQILLEIIKEQREIFLQHTEEGNQLKTQACLLYIAVNMYYSNPEMWKGENELRQCLLHIKQKLGLQPQSNMQVSVAKLLEDYIKNDCLLTHFKENIESVMRSGQPLSQIGKVHVSSDLSLHHALSTKVCQVAETTHDQTKILQKNEKVHSLFKELNLCQYYPKKLRLQDALLVRSDTLRMSLNKVPITHSSQLSHLTLHKIMAYDYLCRSDLMYNCKDRSTKIHPVDNLLALLTCSDDILNQDLMDRLTKCQLAIPFVLPDPFTKQLTLPLWGMKSIIKKWKCFKIGEPEVEHEFPITRYPTPIISFIRIGKRQRRGVSKSKLLNEVISETHYDHFFHRDCGGGHFPLLMGEGLIDTCWYLPAGKPEDAFPNVITFLNLHGDARHYPEQSRFLTQISSMCFALLTEEEDRLQLDLASTTVLKDFTSESVPGGIVLLNDADDPPEKLISMLANSEVIDLPSINVHDAKMSIRTIIKEKLKLSTVNDFRSLEECATTLLNLNHGKLCVDESNDDFRRGKRLAESIIELVSSYKPNDYVPKVNKTKKLSDEGEKKECSVKEAMLPLQGEDMWQKWASLNKELHRQVFRGTVNVRQYTEDIMRERKNVRDDQLEYVFKLTPVMESFIVSLLSLEGEKNKTVRDYFLQCLKLALNDLSRDTISGLQQKYKAVRQALSEAQPKANNSDKTDSEVEPNLNTKVEAYKDQLKIFTNK